ncbi:hypothetical protein [Streptomyces sp. H27-D2]|uniref:hypothetical protein n=1 Tax=Streptomyces sp. H27-D2 TaxID=3046304 RepID=UPI002DBA7902|nr:hypothetical protein [Streptomyces sp. H27-D2]MEC4019178.1 hypothetical protein [Streptomyces sp. H27-D2]
MKRVSTVVAAIMLILGTGACSENTKDADEKSDKADDWICKELLGTSGLEWLTERSKPDVPRFKSTDDPTEARSQFRKQIEHWDPASTGIPMFTESDACRVRTDIHDQNTQLSITYGPSLFPFDSPFGAKTVFGDTPTLTQINSDVKLVHGVESDKSAYYRVYVVCRISGAPAKQENEVPLEGELIDTLTGDTNARVHFTRLLHSTKVITDGLDCKNEPDIPTVPPNAT